MYLGEERHGNRSLDTIHSTSNKLRGHGQFILRPDTLPIVIMEDMLVEVDLCHNTPATIPLAIGEQYFIVKGEFYIGIRLDNIPTITKVAVADF